MHADILSVWGAMEMLYASLPIAHSAAAVGGEGGASFVLGGLLWLLPSLALTWWRTLAQRTFIRLYREAYRVDLPLPAELGTLPGPTYIWRVLRLLREVQSDPALEKARRRVLLRQRLMIGYGCVGVLFPMLFSTVWR